MNLPIKCPVCNEIMITDYPGKWIVTKKCSKFINHQITVSAAITQPNTVYKIVILVSHIPKIEATWHVLSEELWVKKGDETLGISLPYFLPKLTDYPKLIEKIKTYVLFS